jgi:hypothetical protein
MDLYDKVSKNNKKKTEFLKGSHRRILCKGHRIFHFAAAHVRKGGGTPETPYD